ncbi:MAG: hypothetical protein ACRD0H_08110 [Actinomycetes bacterium]
MKGARITHEHGVYTVRRTPVAEVVLGDEPGVIVAFTHDLGEAADVAWPLWWECHESRIGRPSRGWLRKVPGDPYGHGWAFTWCPAVPGTRGASPVVAFAGWWPDSRTPREYTAARVGRWSLGGAR